MALDERAVLEARLAELQTTRNQYQADKERREAKIELDEQAIETIDYYKTAIQERLDALP
jgi:hypothetical protein